MDGFNEEYISKILRYFGMRERSELEVFKIIEHNNGLYFDDFIRIPLEKIEKDISEESKDYDIIVCLSEADFRYFHDTIKTIRQPQKFNQSLIKLLKEFKKVIIFEWDKYEYYQFINKNKKSLIDDFLKSLRIISFEYQNENMKFKLRSNNEKYFLGTINENGSIKITNPSNPSINGIPIEKINFLYSEFVYCGSYFYCWRSLSNFLKDEKPGMIQEGFIIPLVSLRYSFVVSLCKILGNDHSDSFSIMGFQLLFFNFF